MVSYCVTFLYCEECDRMQLYPHHCEGYIKELRGKVTVLRRELLLKVSAEDWEGVADTALELRELLACEKP